MVLSATVTILGGLAELALFGDLRQKLLGLSAMDDSGIDRQYEGWPLQRTQSKIEQRFYELRVHTNDHNQ